MKGEKRKQKIRCGIYKQREALLISSERATCQKMACLERLSAILLALHGGFGPSAAVLHPQKFFPEEA
jgi:hypothetical protein